MKTELLPCPCGKTPSRLSIMDTGQGGKYADVSGDCCGEWAIEFRANYLAQDSAECLELATVAWNSAPRANLAAQTAKGQYIEGVNVERRPAALSKTGIAFLVAQAADHSGDTNKMVKPCSTCGGVGSVYQKHGVCPECVGTGQADHSEQALNMVEPEPFGFFKSTLDGWIDCAESDDGARPLYEHADIQKRNQQIKALQWELKLHSEANANLEQEVLELRTKLEEAQKDAARYRYVKEVCNFVGKDDGVYWYSEDIDAAMKNKNEN